MRLQVNGRYLVQRVTGVQRYAREIVARLGDRVEVIAPLTPAQGMRGHLWEQTVLPCRLKRGLVWSPSNTGPLAVREQVVTIHDTSFADQAHCVNRRFAAWYQFLVPRLARRVRTILTVSHFSAERIAEYCRVPREKIKVVYSGVDPRFHPVAAQLVAAARERLGLPERYLLCVCSLEPRKNLARLLQAWRIAGPQLPERQLVIVGTQGHVFRDAGLGDPPPGVHWCGYLNDDLLPAVYSGAECFAFPSLYEGFGLPVLEAMACGTPIVCSNNSALPEVAGDAAVLVEALDVESIADGLLRVLRSSDLQADLRCRGLARAAEFSWDRTADQTWQVFEQSL